VSTVSVEECTADDETDYVNVKDGAGRPNTNINMSLQDTRMQVILRVHEFEKLMSLHYTFHHTSDLFLNALSTQRKVLQLSTSYKSGRHCLKPITFLLFWNTYLHTMSVRF